MEVKYIDDLLKHFTEIGPSGCSLLISKSGETVYEKCVGFADRENKQPVCEDTLFQMYSSTKVVTAVAALILLERGKYLLNDPISDYLPQFKNMRYYKYAGNNVMKTVPVQNPITIAHLMSMRSGITYAGNYIPTQQAIRDKIGSLINFPQDMNLQEFTRIIADVPLAFEPGTNFHYGFSYDILAALIEVVSGQTFFEFLQKEIFIPLGMKDTMFTVSASERSRLAGLYNRENGELVLNQADSYRLEPGYKFQSGGAGLVSTVRDMERLSRCLSLGGQPILSAHTIDLMRRNQLTTPALLESFNQTFGVGWEFFKGYGYGLGVRVMLDPVEAGAITTANEFGWAGAAGTWTMIDPQLGLSAFYAHQLKPNNMEGYCHPRLRNAIYSVFG